MDSNIEFTVGTYVRIKAQNEIGQIFRIHKKRVWIAINQLRLYLPIEAVEKVEKRSDDSIKISKSIHFQTLHPKKLGDTTLDLHGLNKAQALVALEKFIDRSLLCNHSELKIIHGQGAGILRNAVRQYLQQHNLVKKVIIQNPMYHMPGLTIVEL